MGADGEESSRIIVPMAVEGTPQQLAFVEESKLKKRKENVDWAVRNRERKAAKRQRIRDEHKVIVKRPEDFVTAFRNKERLPADADPPQGPQAAARRGAQLQARLRDSHPWVGGSPGSGTNSPLFFFINGVNS